MLKLLRGLQVCRDSGDLILSVTCTDAARLRTRAEPSQNEAALAREATENLADVALALPPQVVFILNDWLKKRFALAIPGRSHHCQRILKVWNRDHFVLLIREYQLIFPDLWFPTLLAQTTGKSILPGLAVLARRRAMPALLIQTSSALRRHVQMMCIYSG